jgi:hypothetical protein
VTEDQLYKKLRDKLSDEFTPAKPLERAWKRALWIFPISLVFIAATLAVFHLRSDSVNFHPLALYGLIALQILACYLAITVSLETSIPGSFKSPVFLITVGLTGPVVFSIASWIAFRVSPNQPSPDQELRIGSACLSVISLFGLLAILIGYFITRSGLPFRAKAVGIILGLGSGLTAEAAWRLHCPYTSWDHILIFHGGAVFFLLLAGLITGCIWEKKARRS